MLQITSRHAGYRCSFVHWSVRWVARQIGLSPEAIRKLTIEVGYCRDHQGHGRWSGSYKERRVRVSLPRGTITWPQSLAYNQAERDAGWQAADELELFVAVLAHELEHARAAVVAADVGELRTMNHEPTVRKRAWGVLVAFRQEREALVESWTSSNQPSTVTA